jgi:hypothetical protein
MVGKKEKKGKMRKRNGALWLVLVRLGIKCHCVREYGRANGEGRRDWRDRRKKGR